MRAVDSSRVVVVKLGGSVTTDKSANTQTRSSSFDVVALVSALRQADRLPVLVCGAGSYGHGLAKRFGFSSSVGRPIGDDDDVLLQALEVHRSVRRLAQCVCDDLAAASVPAQALFFVAWDATDSSFRHHLAHSLTTLLGAGVVPVLHGDMQFRDASQVYVLSGDIMACCAADVLQCRLLIMISAHAVHTCAPSAHADAPLVTHIDPLSKRCLIGAAGEEVALSSLAAGASAAPHDVSGGMETKLHAVLQFCLLPTRPRAVIVSASHAMAQLERILQTAQKHGGHYTLIAPL